MQVDEDDDQDAALARMLASHDQNMQHQSRPLDEAPEEGQRLVVSWHLCL